MSLVLSLSEIEALCDDELRTQWRAAWGLVPPPKISRGMLEKSLLFKQHEDAGLGLSLVQQKQRDKLVRDYQKNPIAPPPQRIKAGTRLVRVWQGKAYEVLVTETGFTYNGQPYTSLSEIATQITGTTWNGWRFFGVPNPNKAPREKGGAA